MVMGYGIWDGILGWGYGDMGMGIWRWGERDGPHGPQTSENNLQGSQFKGVISFDLDSIYE